MIILYVPFSRIDAGDLVGPLETWIKNWLNNELGSIMILYYGDPIGPELFNNDTKIYICGHGTSDARLEIRNHHNWEQSLGVDIDTVALRFSYDFLFMHHKIKAIHIYCCGVAGKNQAMAAVFKEHILLFDCPLYSYSGALYPADLYGQLWSCDWQEMKPARKTAYIQPTLPCTQQEIAEPLIVTKNAGLERVQSYKKINTLIQAKELTKTRRLNTFFKQREQRAAYFANARKQNPDELQVKSMDLSNSW